MIFASNETLWGGPIVSNTQPVRYAQLAWDEANATPESTEFGDIYFSRGHGLAESDYVFVQGCNLPQHWQSKRTYTVLETGFGTGLNLLALWQLYLQQQAAGQAVPSILHYISFEQYPLHRDDFARALRLHPPSPLKDELLRQYPSPIPGLHRISLQQGRLQLTLCLGDVNHLLPLMPDRAVDAWFLDGFAPAKNPAMWSETLFQHMARLSRSGSVFSTFTAAAMVREGLKTVGFHVQKRPGFGHKRDSLHGYFANPQPVHNLPLAHAITPLVIGAGIAGVCAAYALAQRGITVELWEALDAPAQACSWNPAALCAPVLEAGYSHRTRFYAAALSYSLRFWAALDAAWQPCGWLKLATSPEEEEHQQKILSRLHWEPDILHALTPQQASHLAGYAQPYGGLYSPLAGWVPLPAMIQRMLMHPNLHLRCGHSLQTCQPSAEGWRATTRHGVSFTASHLIFATAEACAGLENMLPTQPSRGQLSFLLPTKASQQQQPILNYGGHVTPPVPIVEQSGLMPGFMHVLGATYQRGDRDTTPRTMDDTHNLQRWHNLLPDATVLPQQVQQGWAGIRYAAPERMPYIGPIPDAVQKDTGTGLYATLAHGSRGSLSAPLAAEILACQITGEPLPLESDLLHAISPMRRIKKHSHQTYRK